MRNGQNEFLCKEPCKLVLEYTETDLERIKMTATVYNYNKRVSVRASIQPTSIEIDRAHFCHTYIAFYFVSVLGDKAKKKKSRVQFY